MFGILVWSLAWAALDADLIAIMRGVDGMAAVAEVESGAIIGSHGWKAHLWRLQPGSAIKPFILEQLIEQGKLGSGGRLMCDGVLRIMGRRLDCSHPRLAAPIDPSTALAYSCNSYFAQMALRLDRPSLVESLRRYGFELTGIPCTDEGMQLLVLGQAGVRARPAGLLDGYRKLVRRRVSDSKLEPLWRGLEAATEFGSGQLAAIPGLAVAGKTGTVPTLSLTSTSAWFVGYAPAANPQVVVLVFVHQGKGGATAAPLAAKIFEAWSKRR